MKNANDLKKNGKVDVRVNKKHQLDKKSCR